MLFPFCPLRQPIFKIIHFLFPYTSCALLPNHVIMKAEMIDLVITNGKRDYDDEYWRSTYFRVEI